MCTNKLLNFSDKLREDMNYLEEKYMSYRDKFNVYKYRLQKAVN